MEVKSIHLDDIPHVDHLVLALGDFDGLHIGHRALLFEAAHGYGGTSAILLFRHPFPSKSVHVLTSLEDKLRLLHPYQLDICFIIEDEVSSLSADEFITKVLKPLGTTDIVCGHDFRFGNKASGDVARLEKDFNVHAIPFVEKNGEKVSASKIKEELARGDLQEVIASLGRVYEVVGKTVKGKQLGRTIGFPTLNLDLSAPYVLPLPGVYAGIAYFQGRYFKALVNVGSNPTINAGEDIHIEVHLLGYEGSDDYGFTCYVSFLSFIRPEETFDSLETLKAQIEKDKASASSVSD